MIDKTELKIVLKALGFDVKKQELEELVSQYDVNESGQILYTDFIDLSDLKSDLEVLRKRSNG